MCIAYMRMVDPPAAGGAPSGDCATFPRHRMAKVVLHKVTSGQSVSQSGTIAALLDLVLALGHDHQCPAITGPACTCGKVGRLRDAHGEACRILRDLGYLKE